MKSLTDLKRKTFKTNEEYFKFIDKHRGEIGYINVTWKDDKIKCQYKLKERRKSNGNSINNPVNNFVNNYVSSSNYRDSK